MNKSMENMCCDVKFKMVRLFWLNPSAKLLGGELVIFLANDFGSFLANIREHCTQHNKHGLECGLMMLVECYFGTRHSLRKK